MSIRALVITILACFGGNVLAADVETIERWTAEIASVIAKDLRSALVNERFYSDQIVGLDKDSVAQQISLLQAVCMVDAYIRLAEKHSIALKDVFVGPQAGLIDADAFSISEVREETSDCSKNAFIASGIKWDNSLQN